MRVCVCVRVCECDWLCEWEWVSNESMMLLTTMIKSQATTITNIRKDSLKDSQKETNTSFVCCCCCCYCYVQPKQSAEWDRDYI